MIDRFGANFASKLCIRAKHRALRLLAAFSVLGDSNMICRVPHGGRGRNGRFPATLSGLATLGKMEGRTLSRDSNLQTGETVHSEHSSSAIYMYKRAQSVVRISGRVDEIDGSYDQVLAREPSR